MELDSRMHLLNQRPIMLENPFVIYWMQAAQRVQYNHALYVALEQAQTLKKPLIVYVVLDEKFPEANRRSFHFMIQGLHDVSETLRAMNIGFRMERNTPTVGVLNILSCAALLITDSAYTKVERSWRTTIAQNAQCSVIEVETNVVVPVGMASSKEEYSATTLRRKILPMIPFYCDEVPLIECKISSLDIEIPNTESSIVDVDDLLIDHSVRLPSGYRGGYVAAKAQLAYFIDNHLSLYEEKRSDPSVDCTSHMSPYLHFGHISPIEIYRKVRDCDAQHKEAFFEELIVRRELSMNFVRYNPLYDQFEGLPNWAKRSLESHDIDPRENRYTAEQLESGQTADPYWNCAQAELVHLGTMHGYMRMYWGKKIIQWSSSAKEAFPIALYLNNTYQLDGRDPNGYTGVAWCFGKHDRPWVERPIFGNVRYMNDKGLERKFNMARYLKRVEDLIKKEKRESL